MFVFIVFLFIVSVVVVFSYILTYFLFSFVRNYIQVDVLVQCRCPSLETKWQSVGLGKKGVTKVFKHGQKIPSGLKTT